MLLTICPLPCAPHLGHGTVPRSIAGCSTWLAVPAAVVTAVVAWSGGEQCCEAHTTEALAPRRWRGGAPGASAALAGRGLLGLAGLHPALDLEVPRLAAGVARLVAVRAIGHLFRREHSTLRNCRRVNTRKYRETKLHRNRKELREEYCFPRYSIEFSSHIPPFSMHFHAFSRTSFLFRCHSASLYFRGIGPQREDL